MKKIIRVLAGLGSLLCLPLLNTTAHAGDLHVWYYYSNSTQGYWTTQTPQTYSGGHPGFPMSGDGTTYVDANVKDDRSFTPTGTVVASNTMTVHIKAIYEPDGPYDKPSSLKIWESGLSTTSGTAWYAAGGTCSGTAATLSINGNNAFSDPFNKTGPNCNGTIASVSGNATSPSGGRLIEIPVANAERGIEGSYIFTGPTRVLSASSTYGGSGSGSVTAMVRYATRTEISKQPIWVKEPVLTPGTITNPTTQPVYLHPGQTLSLQATGGSDQDTYYPDDVKHTQSVSNKWSAIIADAVPTGTTTQGTFTNTNTLSTVWTAPALPSGTNQRDIDIVCTYDDPTPNTTDRDDPPVHVKLRVIVAKKQWFVGTKVGKARDAAGNVTDDGQIIVPLDQSAPGFTAKSVPVLPNSYVPFEIQTASDWDFYREFPNSPDSWDKDTITDDDYEWTCAEGGIFEKTVGTNVISDEKMYGRNVRFKIPARAALGAQYTVKCTFYNTHGKSIAANEAGTRLDLPHPISVRTQVLVVAGGSARLSIHKTTADPTSTKPEQTEELNDSDPIGGKRQVVLNLHLDKGIKVLTGGRYIRIKELPDTANGVTHGPNKDHVDRFVPFNQNGNWERLYDPDGTGPKVRDWWPAPEPPSNPPANTVNEYRYRMDWYTYDPYTATGVATTTLHGHNGLHELSIESDGVNDGSFINLGGALETGGSTGPWAARVNSRQYTVDNFTLVDVQTNNGTSDYFKFDPNAAFTSPLFKPSISFTVADAGDSMQYLWRLKIRSTSSADNAWLVTAEGKMASRGTKTVVVNYPAGQDTQVGTIGEKGTYTFDIEVSECVNVNVANPIEIDTISYRSATLDVPLTYQGVDPNTGASILVPGHQIYEEYDAAGDAHLGLMYRLQDTDNTAAANVDITVFDHLWQQKAFLPGNRAVGVTHDERVWSFDTTSESGYYKALITAKDGQKQRYRDHKNSPMVAINSYTPSHAIEWIEGVDPATNKQFYGVWVKRQRLGHSTNRQIRTDLLAVGTNGVLPTIYERVWDKVLRGMGWVPNTTTILPRSQAGRTWAGINGTFFNHQNDSMFKVQGDVGVNGVWTTPETPGGQFRRWSFGISSSGFAVEQMANVGPPYQSTATIKAHPSGLGGVGCLIKGGVKVSPGSTVMAGNVNGEYSELSKKMARSMTFWSNDGKHMFMILVQGDPLTGANGVGWTWQDAQNAAFAGIPAFITTYTSKLKAKGKTAAPLTITTGDAMLLDGGSHSSLVYVREKVTASPNGNIYSGAPGSSWNDAKSVMSDPFYVEAWDYSGAPYYPIPDGDSGGHRQNRTVLEAFIR